MDKVRTLKEKIIICTILLIAFILGVLAIMNYYNLLPKDSYNSLDFGIEEIHSNVDYDNDGVDDYSDFLLGARKDAENHPTYISKYYEDAYPPDYEGVCTDVVWRAFKEAGYSLRDMMDYDITNNPEDYDEVYERDNKIDFRRVPNQRVFFEKYSVSLTLDPYDIEEWQPGDIVFINDNHVGIVSDKRTKSGVAYLIHNAGRPIGEEDYLTKKKITGHFRFDASLVPDDVLKRWNENS